ncbi:MAG TPA: preQ(1) synthase [Thermoanaerobaculia bacterium]|nr:preQ(1) synthase [Thermoanaerobaculia bacterium]
MGDYTEEHARSGIEAELPALETWPNQYPDYEITVEIPEYNAICPKTGLPDFGHLTIRYVPDRDCLELKSLKLYIVAFRDLGIFYENAVNRILDDCAAACRPKSMSVRGTFSSRGGISSVVEARYPRAAAGVTSTEPAARRGGTRRSRAAGAGSGRRRSTSR